MNGTASPRLWYSFFGGEYNETTCFYEKNGMQWVQQLESSWPVIKAELEEFLSKNQQRLVPYFNEEMVSGPKKWKALAFMFWTVKFKKNMKQCPETMRLLEQVPHLVSASISLLEPHTQIKPHRGDTNGIIRCHLGLIVPSHLPDCGFQVGDEQRSWEEGKFILFNDAMRHLAWNNTNERRLILLLDVIRPEFAEKKGHICRIVLAALALQYLSQKMRFLKKSSRRTKRAVHTVLKGFVALALPFKR